VERSFYGDVDQIVERAPTASHDGRLDDHLMVLSDQADELQERISNLLDVVQRGDHAAMGRVRVLEGELKGITDQIEGIASDREALSNALIQARAKMLQEAVEDQDVPKINAALRLLMERIVIDMELATLTYHYRGGGEFTMLYKMA
jgi:hypothetical protein